MTIVIGSKGGCFPSYAKVETATGEIEISKIKVGDIILSYNFEGIVEEAEVLAVHTHEDNLVCRYYYWGGYLDATPNHWVLNQYNTFASIGTLTEDDCLVDSLGHLRPVLNSEILTSQTVYNLTVSPNHTFIVGGIRVHNGGIGATKPVIGSKGGSKGGGGRVAVEDPNTLRSREYARVLDLISEGEIEGLVNGFKSIYYDDVPLQNYDNTYNFKNVLIETRNGTQDQTVLSDLNSVENAIEVNTRIYQATPVVRRVSNLEADEAYITLEFPQLTYQDTSTGDLHGSSVDVTIQVKNDADNIASVYKYVPMSWITVTNAGTYSGASTVIRAAGTYKKQETQPLNTSVTGSKGSLLSNPINAYSSRYSSTWGSTINVGMGIGLNTIKLPALSSQPQFLESDNCNNSKLTVVWKTADSVVRTVRVGVYYRAYGSGTWILYNTLIFKGSAHPIYVNVGMGFYGMVGGYVPTYQTQQVSIAHSLGRYEFKAELLAGYTTYGVTGILSAESHVQKLSDTITGKTISRYQRGYTIPLTAPGPWDIKITRVTADSSTSNIANQTWWASYVEVVKAKLTYPNSALVYTAIDAEQFSNIPKRAYEIYGIKCKIPSNYDPHTRIYTGFWDGTFVVDWTDNPAWVFYDIVTNTRYGLGGLVESTLIDKWVLYSISQYCDELVNDGKGGQEPRFTCNLYIQAKEDAYKVVSNLASIFRAMVYWSSGLVTLSQDAPRSTDAIYTAANVIDGSFSYTGTSAKSRHNVVLVSWNNPNTAYSLETEYIEDADSVSVNGINQTDIVAMGCTSKGQAHRLGKWLLYTEQYETETVTFRTGLHGLTCNPGDVIQTQDPFRAGLRLGGRISSISTTPTQTIINIDGVINYQVGKTYSALLTLPDNTIITKTLANTLNNTDQSTLIINSVLPILPAVGSIWIVAVSDLSLQSWRVISTNEVSKGVIEVTALSYNADKFAAVEKDVILVEKTITAIEAVPYAVSDITITEHMYKAAPKVISNVVSLSWTPNSYGINNYEVSYTDTTNSANTLKLSTNLTNIEIYPINEANYDFTVTAIDPLGVRSQTVSVNYTVIGKTAPPVNVSGLFLKGETQLLWNANTELDIDGYQVRFHQGINTDWGTASLLHAGLIYTPEYTFPSTLVNQITLLVKAFDTSGNESVLPAYLVTDFGQQLVNNVVETKDYFALGWPGTISGGTISGFTGYIDGVQNSAFYKTDTVAFYDLDGTIFYTGNWDAMSWETTVLEQYKPSPVAIGSTMSLNWDISGSNLSVQYIPIGATSFFKASFDSFYSLDTDMFYVPSPDWAPWIGAITVQDTGYLFKVTTQTGIDTAQFKGFSVVADVPDTLIASNNVLVSSAGTTRLTDAIGKFYSIQNVQLTLHSGGTAVYLEIVDKNTTLGPLIQAKDASGTLVDATVDAIIQGY